MILKKSLLVQPEKSLEMTDRYHKLYFYKSTQEKAVPLLLVYSLINRPYIFDLAKGRSLIEFLCDQGFDVYLLDWSDPTSESAHMSLEDMVFGTSTQIGKTYFKQIWYQKN